MLYFYLTYLLIYTMTPLHNHSKKSRILIIEDSAAIQKLTKEVLTFHKDYEVVFARNGKIGLDLIKESDPFDIILVDIDMPVMSGEQCINAIRSLKDSVKANVPVIVCTGNAKEYTKQDFSDMGFSDSFIKPIDYQGLIKKIIPMLEQRGSK